MAIKQPGEDKVTGIRHNETTTGTLSGKMNYIELINKFWQCDIERPISPADTRMYFYLVRTCNGLGWKVPFGHSDRYLSNALGISVNTVRSAKNRLKQIGLIDFSTPDKASKGIDGQTRYWFTTVSKNDTVPDTVIKSKRKPTVSMNDTDSATVPDTDSATVPDTDSATVPDTNNKLNKTKQNNTATKVAGTDKDSGDSNPEEKEKSSAQKEKDATPHWHPLVATWFEYYKQQYGMEPTFQGQDSKAMKALCANLQKRTEERRLVWTEAQAVETLLAFLNYAGQDKWLKENFLLPNLSRQFDKIVANATKGTGNQNAVADALARANAMHQ